MKKLKLSNITKGVLSIDRIQRMTAYATAKCGFDINVYTDDSDSCYCSGARSHYNRGYPLICLGSKFYTSVSEDKEIEDLDIQEAYRSVASVYTGAFYHEFFHMVYTPFEYCLKHFSGMSPGLLSIVKPVTNILEDISIEKVGKINYKRTKTYIDIMNDFLFNEDRALKTLDPQIKNDPDNIGTMISYLLFYLYGTDLSNISSYKKFEDNRKLIDTSIEKCVNESDPNKRFDYQVAFATQLIDLFDFKVPDMSAFESLIGNLIHDYNDTGQVVSGAAKDLVDSIANSMNNYSYQIRNNPRSLVAISGNADDSKDDLEVDFASNIDIQGMRDNIDLMTEPHREVRLDASNLTTSEYYKKTYNDVVADNESYIRTIVALLRKTRSHNNNETVRNQFSGDFDIRASLKPNNIRFFKRDIAPSEESDLMFNIICDFSGSMRGTKSTLLGKALIIFSEVLNRLRIPFTIHGFVEDGLCSTIIIKDLNDDYNKVKYNLSTFINQPKLGGLLYQSNIDEVNINYLYNKFRRLPNKDKVMVVMSDGMTCGSRKVLKDLIGIIEKEITVLGIGLKNPGVRDYYSKNIVMDTDKDLEMLAPFLNDYLVKNFLRQGR